MKVICFNNDCKWNYYNETEKESRCSRSFIDISKDYNQRCSYYEVKEKTEHEELKNDISKTFIDRDVKGFLFRIVDLIKEKE